MCHRFIQGLVFSWLLLCFVGYPAVAAELSDGQKKQQISSLYSEYQQEFPAVAVITPEELMQRMNNGDDLVLIDTREEGEMDVSMLPGAVSTEDFHQHFDRYKNSFLVAYCTIGYRSGLLAAEMLDKKIVIHNLEGGILGWIHTGGAVMHEGKISHQVHVYGRKWDLAPAGYETVKYSFFKQLF